jgi:ABC-type Na+ efflux pump permease subunit
MLIAMIVAARWAIRRFHVPQTLGATLSMGLIAIGLLFPTEIAGVLWVRGVALHDYPGSFATVPGVISLFMFLLFTSMPTLVARFTAAAWQHGTLAR